ncbi:MAG: (Fe-S)-binding protein [Bacteroidetes bacterium]|nr:MAG: (Fe-S)-binding protein [Bacteroidota bacterium]REK00045.1 MAG: (Fe-S)-binding protein [Bacteroidota bacterium]REK35774.1 MAG: (Fe-S)-binding protein [Bacteroidota bacterium]REK49353.1 MAG: (Fe-S)-binding protein [Bacteroidota bacterium]
MISQVLFTLILAGAVFWFASNVGKIRRNILLGREFEPGGLSSERWKTMAMVALGQSKMVTRPVAGILHFFVYAGFVIINIEVMEILIDGMFGTHRVFSGIGALYDVLIGSFEILAFMVLLACVIFLIRRNILKLKRFWMPEMTSWPRTDANLILITEILLMAAFLTMNAADSLLQDRGYEHYVIAGAFPVSSFVSAAFAGLSSESLFMIERFCWWFHIIGILAFLNYIPYSKHFHIFLAFPNTYYSNLNSKGKFNNMESVTREVKLMLDPSATPPADAAAAPARFGAKDVQDLTWKQLMDAYSCTECGRCSSVCPANQTGKLLSPRKIMMDTRDRLEEVGKGIDKNGKEYKDEKSLFDYISEEELWACTTCNACTEACPVNIDPLGIIVDLRRFLVMEESKVPAELGGMFNKIENNGAPWQFAQADRMNWPQSDS